MTELPEPLTPADCDLRHYDWMPLTITVLKGSRAWLRCKRNPALAFYFVNLWTAAWHQVPAASLEDDDEYLCDLAQCDEETWAKLKSIIMSGFVKCSDGRLYHQYVAREANKSWQLYLAQRSRTEAATAARRAKQTNVTSASSSPSAPPSTNVTSNVTNNVTSNVTKDVTYNETEDVTEDVTIDATFVAGEPLRSPHTRPTRPTRPTNLKEESSVPTERATASPSPPDPPDARTEFWREGLSIVRSLTGRPDGASRAFLGRILKTLADDCEAGLQVLHAANDLRPGGPEAWIVAACEARATRKTTGISARKEKILRAGGLWPEEGTTIDATTPERFLIQ